ncbi:MAG: hypothetical protein JO104_06335 [Candidatus Eremiobacteraeota bacterium]|nr:hypothetical protein [Candidatus Eremiobacteraeota bacterium]
MLTRRIAVLVTVALLEPTGCSHGTRMPGRAASPAATRHAAPLHAAPTGPRAQPSAETTPSAASTASASSLPAASGRPTLPPAPRKVVRLPPDAAPRILGVTVSETTVQPGDRVSGRVLTTSNVASVEARIGGYSVNLVKVGVGRFELIYTVAPLPWFVHGDFTMQVIARNTHGDAVTRAVPLTVR